jgi:hypothetical protein
VLNLDGDRGFWFHSERDELLFNDFRALAAFAGLNSDPDRNYEELLEANQDIQTVSIRRVVPYPDNFEDSLIQYLLAFRDLRFVYLQTPTGPLPRYQARGHEEENDEEQTSEDAIRLWLLDGLRQEHGRHGGTFRAAEIRFRTEAEFQEIVDREGEVSINMSPPITDPATSGRGSFGTIFLEGRIDSPFATLSERARARNRYLPRSEDSVIDEEKVLNDAPSSLASAHHLPRDYDSDGSMITKEQYDQEKEALEDDIRREEDARRNRLKDYYKKAIKASNKEKEEWKWKAEHYKAQANRHVARLQLLEKKGDWSDTSSDPRIDEILDALEEDTDSRAAQEAALQACEQEKEELREAFDDLQVRYRAPECRKTLRDGLDIDEDESEKERKALQKHIELTRENQLKAAAESKQEKLRVDRLERELQALRVECRSMLQKEIESEKEEIEKIQRQLRKVKGKEKIVIQ